MAGKAARDWRWERDHLRYICQICNLHKNKAQRRAAAAAAGIPPSQGSRRQHPAEQPARGNTRSVLRKRKHAGVVAPEEQEQPVGQPPAGRQPSRQQHRHQLVPPATAARERQEQPSPTDPSSWMREEIRALHKKIDRVDIFVQKIVHFVGTTRPGWPQPAVSSGGPQQPAPAAPATPAAPAAQLAQLAQLAQQSLLAAVLVAGSLQHGGDATRDEQHPAGSDGPRQPAQ